MLYQKINIKKIGYPDFVSEYVKYAIALTPVILLASVGPAFATENGLDDYPLGSESIDVSIKPPPGHLELQGYNFFYSANLYSGPKKETGDDVRAYINAYLITYTWPVSFYDGKITISSEVVLGGGTQRLSISTPVGKLTGSTTGLIDPILMPALATYHGEKFAITLGPSVIVPAGTYNKSNPLASGPGVNHYTFAPLIYFTGELSNKLQLDMMSETGFSTINPHTKYTSGIDTTILGALSYSITPHLQAGPVSYLYEQLTDDKQEGVVIHKGNKGQTLALGAQVIYNFRPGTALVLKYYHDTFVQNRAGGNELWLEFAIPIGG